MHLASMNNNVYIWSFDEEEARLINEEKKCKFLPEITIPENITCKTDYKEVIEGAEFILHVTPSKFTRSTFNKYKQFVGNKPIVICSKGLEDSTLLTLDEVMKEELPGVRVATLSGPSYATEVAAHIPTAVILASEDTELLEEVLSSTSIL